MKKAICVALLLTGCGSDNKVSSELTKLTESFTTSDAKKVVRVKTTLALDNNPEKALETIEKIKEPECKAQALGYLAKYHVVINEKREAEGVLKMMAETIEKIEISEDQILPSIELATIKHKLNARKGRKLMKQIAKDVYTIVSPEYRGRALVKLIQFQLENGGAIDPIRQDIARAEKTVAFIQDEQTQAEVEQQLKEVLQQHNHVICY